MALAKRCLRCGARTEGGSYCADCSKRREHVRNQQPAQRAQLRITREQRRRVYERYRCRDCGSGDNLTLDHVTPLARAPVKVGVRDDELQTLCRSCNSRKGACVPHGIAGST